MANCLMQINQCGFPNCSQHFANQYDLTAHIEYTHIPVIEEEVKRKKQIAATNGSKTDQPVQPSTPNLPLSYYSRVFRTAYRPNPIKPEPLKVSFNHYKKRAQKEKQVLPGQMASRILRDMMARQGRHITIEEAEKRLQDIDFEECGLENNEVRFLCNIIDCHKRYKSMFALRVHMKIVHNVLIADDAKSLTNYPSEDVKPNIAALQQSMQQQALMNAGSVDNIASSGTPTTVPSNAPATPLAQGSPHSGGNQSFGNPATNTTSFKCSYCSKRYKTSSGLSNHMMASHQKISDIQDAPSAQVVEQLISQVRMQRQQQEQNNSEQSQRNPPPQASQSPTIANILKGPSHARSFSVTTTQQPIRFAQQHYQVNLDNQPSTGQVLQMQMQHQKRLKQIQELKQVQEQQAAQAIAAAAQHQNQHQQSMVMQQGQYSSSMSQMGQNVLQSSPQAVQMGQMQQQQQFQQQQQMQQYHHVSSQQQQHSPYPQQMHQMAQQSPHSYQKYQRHQQSPQFSQYQQPSPQQPQQPNAPPPQRSPVPLSQSLPPLNSMTQQQRSSLQQMPPPNSTPMQFSPQSYNMMPSPTSGQQISSQPPPYNL